MIDFHSHLLPGIDDGSQSTQESMAMLDREYAQGVRTVAATPHFYADTDNFNDFLQRRMAAFCKVEEACAARQAAVPQIMLGAEVHFFSGIGKADMIPQLCIGETGVLLLELPFRQWDSGVLDEVEKLIELQHLTVLAAHLERYFQFQKDNAYIEELLEMPVFVQVNAGAFLRRNVRKHAFRLAGQRSDVVIGSDCHNLHSRPPNIEEAARAVRKKLGDACLQQIEETGRRLLGVC